MTSLLSLGRCIFCCVVWLFTFELACAKDKSAKVNWLAISDLAELEKTWAQSLVFVPKSVGKDFGRLLSSPNRFDALIDERPEKRTLPLILYMHSCEGLGHHREDLKRYARLGFVVIAPDSFARDHRPLGCNEEREKFLHTFDAALAFQKAELDYAVEKLSEFNWVDRDNVFLFGSGMGGIVAAQYEGTEFSGHLIEGWGCRGPNPVFDGIRAPKDIRIFSSVSRNDPWYQKNPGFGVDCESFIRERPGSVSVVLDRPAHYVSWYPKSYKALIRFLTRDMNVDTQSLTEDLPVVLQHSADGIELGEKWSDTAVFETAKRHCEGHDRKSYQIAEPLDGIYRFVCE